LEKVQLVERRRGRHPLSPRQLDFSSKQLLIMPNLYKLFILAIFIGNTAFAQNNKLVVETYHPNDRKLFNQRYPDFDFDYNNDTLGKTTKLIYTRGTAGELLLVLKKKILRTYRISYYRDFAVHEQLDSKSQSWRYVKDGYQHPNTTEQPTAVVTETIHNLYALILLSDHGGYVEKSRFQVFGNEVYWPTFDYPNCFAADEDNNGIPEFYLTYMGMSDGLDAKPYSQIVYTTKGRSFFRSKAVAYFPAGNPEDEYHQEFDSNWKGLPLAIQNRSRSILNTMKPGQLR
jgi:hypothetical protein